jgi:hypothetical protein
MKAMKRILPCQVFEQREGGCSALKRRIAASWAGLSALSILGCTQQAEAAISFVMQSYPWSGGTLSWTGDQGPTGSQTFSTVYCSVVSGGIAYLHAPGEPMTMPKDSLLGPTFQTSPGSTFVDIGLGLINTLEFHTGDFREKQELPPQGLSPVKDGERYGVTFHDAEITVYGPGMPRTIKLNGTLWCNRVQTMRVSVAR